MAPEEHLSVYLAALAPLAESDGARLDAAALAADLRERIEVGRKAWPNLPLDDATFLRHLASHASGSIPPAKHAADLWLACACATGIKGAAAAFEKEHGVTLRRAVARVSRALEDEVTQAVMVSLFVGDPSRRPRIADYGGRAALRTWLATVATNAALNHAQKRDNRAYDSINDLDLAATGMGAELALVRACHGEALDAALRDALAALDERRRVLLRLHHVQGCTVDRLATMYRVSRSAAGRLMVDARTTLLEDIRRRLGERLNLTPSELESLVAVLKSELQVSLVRMLDA